MFCSNHKLTIGMGMVCALGLAAPTVSQALPAEAASCQLYAVNDEGLNNSQLITIDKETHDVNPLGNTPMPLS